MNVSITIPENLVQHLNIKESISQFTKEAFAIEAYRKGIITGLEVQELLNLENRFAVDAFLKKAKTYSDYSEEDLQSDIDVIQKALHQ